MFISFLEFYFHLQIYSIFWNTDIALALPGSVHRLLSNTFMTSHGEVYDVFAVLWSHMVVLNKNVGSSIENKHEKCRQKWAI